MGFVIFVGIHYALCFLETVNLKQIVTYILNSQLALTITQINE